MLTEKEKAKIVITLFPEYVEDQIKTIRATILSGRTPYKGIVSPKKGEIEWQRILINADGRTKEYNI